MGSLSQFGFPAFLGFGSVFCLRGRRFIGRFGFRGRAARLCPVRRFFLVKIIVVIPSIERDLGLVDFNDRIGYIPDQVAE